MPRIALIVTVALLSALSTAPSFAADSAVRWQSDIEGALASAAQTNRLVLVHFWGSNCPPCVRLENTVYKDPQFAAVLEADFVPVKVNVDQFPVTAQRYGVRARPTDVVLTPDGKVAATSSCPADGVEYARRLRETASSIRRNTGQYAQADPRAAAATNQYGAPRETVANYAAGQDADRDVSNPVESTAPASATLAERRYANDFDSRPPQDYAAPARSGAYTSAPPAAAPRMTTRDVPTAKSAAEESRNALPYGNAAPGSNAAANYSPPSVSPGAGGNAYAGAAPSVEAARPAVAAVPSTAPVLCLDGQCPVTLMETQKMVPGDRRFGAVHRGRLYLFVSAAAQQRFLAEPDRYSPAISGHDAVVWVEQGQLARGEVKFGGYYNGFVYLFASEGTLRQFEANPERYAIPAQQAIAAGRGQGQVRR